jgi:hypothetical protein
MRASSARSPIASKAVDAEGPRGEACSDECAHPPDRGRADRIGFEEDSGVVARGQVPSADVPVQPQIAAELKAGFERVGVTSACGGQERPECGFEIGLLCEASLDRRALSRPLDAVSNLAGERGVPLSVPQRDFVGLAGRVESFSCVLADRLQHSQSVAALCLHERLVDERLNTVERRRIRVGTDGFDVLERAAACEDRHPPEESLLRLRQKRMAPVDRCAERLLPPRAVAVPGREHVESMVEALQECVRRQQS